MIYTVFLLTIFFITLPLQMILGVLVLASGYPILFRQKRVGKNGRTFTMYKFRTMVPGAHKLQSNYKSQNESQGPTFKLRNDPRFTRIGKFLSHTGLDELPQLWNVLRGDMALIGPRPLPVDEAKKLKPWMRVRHDILPGIISPAILTGRYHEDFEEWMRSDVAYVKSKNAWEDIGLLIQSVGFWMSLLARAMRRY